MIAATSPVVRGKHTTSGAAGVWYDSPWLWCSRTDAASVARAHSASFSARIARSRGGVPTGVAMISASGSLVVAEGPLDAHVPAVRDRLEHVAGSHLATVDVQRDRRLVECVRERV